MTVPAYLIHYTKLASRLTPVLDSLAQLNVHPQVVTCWDSDVLPSHTYIPNRELWSDRVAAIKHCLFANANGGYNVRSVSELYRLSNIAFSTVGWMRPRTLNGGEVSVLLKHYYALSCAANGSHPYTLILEDDILLSKRSPEYFKAALDTFMENKGEYLDLAGGSGLTPSLLKTSGKINNIVSVRPASTRCNAAYVISKELARAIVNRFFPLILPIDWHLQYYLTLLGPIRCFWADPEALIHGSETSLIQSWRQKS